MNYLELCQRTRMECGISGSDNTVEAATGEWLRVCTWVAQAWQDIQMEFQDFDLLRNEIQFTTVPQQQEYAPSTIVAGPFLRWRNNSFRLIQNSLGDERILDQMPFNLFRDTYLISTNKISYQVPTIVSVGPRQELYFALPPLGEYQITAEYYAPFSELFSDDAVPNLPDHYHMLIVYRAMQHFAGYENAQEVMVRASVEYQKLKEKLMFDFLPPVLVSR